MESSMATTTTMEGGSDSYYDAGGTTPSTPPPLDTTTPSNNNEDEEDAGCAEANNPDDEAELIKNWESHWTFGGYMAWALWGHICMPGLDPEFKSQQFLTGDEDKDGRQGDEKEKKKKKGRKSSCGVDDNHPKVPVSSKGSGTFDHESSSKQDISICCNKLLQEQLNQTVEFNAAFKEQCNNEHLIAIITRRIDDANMKIMELSSIVYSKPECFEDPEVYMDWYPFKVYQENSKKRDDLLRELEILPQNEMIEVKKMEEEEQTKLRKRKEQEEQADSTSLHSSRGVPSQVIASGRSMVRETPSPTSIRNGTNHSTTRTSIASTPPGSNEVDEAAEV